MGRGVVGWRVETAGLESGKDAMCFPLGKIIRPLESGMEVKIGCGRDGTHPRLQYKYPLNYPSDND